MAPPSAAIGKQLDRLIKEISHPDLTIAQIQGWGAGPERVRPMKEGYSFW